MPALKIWKTPRATDQSVYTYDAKTGVRAVQKIETWRAQYADNTTKSTDIPGDTDGDTVMPVVGQLIDGLIVTRVQPTRNTDSPLHWTVQVESNSPTREATANGSILSIDFSSDAVTEDAYYDANYNAITTYNHEYFDPSVPGERADERITISFTSSHVDLSALKALRGKCNGAAVTLNVNGYSETFRRYELRCVDVGFSTVVGAVPTTWQGKITFVARPILDSGVCDTIDGGASSGGVVVARAPGGWYTAIMHRGYFYIDGSGHRTNKVDGKVLTQPVNLGATGHMLGDDTSPQLICYKQFLEADFGTAMASL